MPHVITARDGRNHTIFDERDILSLVDEYAGYEVLAELEEWLEEQKAQTAEAEETAKEYETENDQLRNHQRLVFSDRGAIRCGCWAHLRRKFYDSILNHNMDLPSLGREGVRYCDRLFRIEERLENVDPEERLRIRRKEALPIAEEFYVWLESRDPAYRSQKEAITYARNQKAELMRFLEDGRIPISNNAAENAIRPFVIGRKNWLFCKSNDGAVAAADAYSLVETAKANRLDVLKYLNYVFRKIPMADGNLTDDFLKSLMPWNEAVRAECLRG